MTREDLNLIGQRHATSKCHTLSDLEDGPHYLGYRGEALASTVEVSGTVEISSRHHLSRQTYSKIFFHGRPRNVTLSSNQRPSVGTTVTVHDFFYNLPVRRKALSAVLEMENVRQALQGIALANPSISFSLRNDLAGECVMQTRKTSSILSSFSMLFGSGKAGSMKEVSAELGEYVVRGYISTNSHHNKLLQFLYINGRLVKKTPLHSCVNKLIANSLIARGLSRQSTSSKWRSGNEGDLKRASDKQGVYVLMLKCPRTEYDICLEPAKTLVEFKEWDIVLDCFSQMVRQFLIKYNLTLGPECVEDETEQTSRDSDQLEAETTDEQNSPTRSCGGDDSNIQHSSIQSAIMRVQNYSQDNYKKGSPQKSISSLKTDMEREKDTSEPPQHSNKPLRSPLSSSRASSKLPRLPEKRATSNNLPAHAAFAYSRDKHPSQELLMSHGRPVLEGGSSSLTSWSDANPTSGGESTVSRQGMLTIDQPLLQSMVTEAQNCPSQEQAQPMTTEAVHSQLSFSKVNDIIAEESTFPYKFRPQEISSDGTGLDSMLGSIRSLPECFKCQANATALGSELTRHTGGDSDVLDLTDGEVSYIVERTETGFIVQPSEEVESADMGVEIYPLTTPLEDSETDRAMCSTDDEISCIVERTETGFIIKPNEGAPDIDSQDEALEVDPAVTKESHCNSPPAISSIWKEKIDPRTAKKVYVHSRTGMCRSSKPEHHTDSVAAGRSLDMHHTEPSEAQVEPSSSYGAKPSAAAPHLSFDFQQFLPPSSKRLRLSHSVSDRAVADDEALGSGEEREGGETSFQRLFRSWKNPVFLPGQEVIGQVS